MAKGDLPCEPLYHTVQSYKKYVLRIDSDAPSVEHQQDLNNYVFFCIE